MLAVVTGVIPCVIAYVIGWAITQEGPADGGAAAGTEPEPL